jgi:hypothetical protein
LGVPSEHIPVCGSHAPASRHAPAAHVTAAPPTHEPFWHASDCVQAFPSLHVVPLGFGTPPVQLPVAGSHVPPSRHAVPAQSTALPPVQEPFWHVSNMVQALPSLQAVPFGFGAPFVQAPAASHEPASRHGSEDAQETVPAQVPDPLHASRTVHSRPSSHVVPLGLATHWPVLTLHV